MAEILIRPIGTIQSPFTDPVGMPVQPAAGRGVKGRIILDPDYVDGLKDLIGFSHLILIYYFHQAGEEQLQVKPFLDDEVRGVFSTRAPRRPNRIGISIVRLNKIDGNLVEIEDLDILDGTPVLDIKPYVPDFDPQGPIRVGWLEKRRGEIKDTKADDRFVQD